MRYSFKNLHRVVNPKFYPLLFNENRFECLRGGRGSGKSRFIAQKVIYRIVTEQGHKAGVFRKVRRTLVQSVLVELQSVIDAWGLASLFTLNKTDLVLTYTPTGNTIHLLGLDDPEKIKSFSGLTFAWIEEATELTRDDFIAVNMILRGLTPNYKQISLTFNPISMYHWLKSYFYDSTKQADRVVLHHSTYRDNRFIDQDYKNELEALRDIDDALAMIYADGEWGELKNLIYSKWTVSPFDWTKQANKDEAFGLDFGFANPSALIHLGFIERECRATELIYESHLTDDDLITKLKEVIPADKRHAPIWADSAQPGSIKALQRAGFRVYPADKAVSEGIRDVQLYDLIVESSSQNLINELTGYKWREMRATGEVLDEPVKFRDHLMDALRYPIHSRRAALLRAIKAGDVKGRKTGTSDRVLTEVF